MQSLAIILPMFSNLFPAAPARIAINRRKTTGRTARTADRHCRTKFILSPQKGETHVWMYVNARGDGSRGTSNLRPARPYAAGQRPARHRRTEMRPLRFPAWTGLRVLSQLRHESQNSGMFRLRPKSGSILESLRLLWLAPGLKSDKNCRLQ